MCWWYIYMLEARRCVVGTYAGGEEVHVLLVHMLEGRMCVVGTYAGGEEMCWWYIYWKVGDVLVVK